MSEVWQEIAGSDGVYFVSDLGRVLRKATHIKWRTKRATIERDEPERIMKQRIGRGGYPIVSLRIGRKNATFSVHRLVCCAFHGPQPDGMECAHLDGVPTNPAAQNLRWVTPKENASHRAMHGTLLLGERNHSAKLTREMVSKIRERSAIGATLRELASEFGIAHSHLNSFIFNASRV